MSVYRFAANVGGREPHYSGLPITRGGEREGSGWVESSERRVLKSEEPVSVNTLPPLSQVFKGGGGPLPSAAPRVSLSLTTTTTSFGIRKF